MPSKGDIHELKGSNHAKYCLIMTTRLVFFFFPSFDDDRSVSSSGPFGVITLSSRSMDYVQMSSVLRRPKRYMVG